MASRSAPHPRLCNRHCAPPIASPRFGGDDLSLCWSPWRRAQLAHQKRRTRTTHAQPRRYRSVSAFALQALQWGATTIVRGGVNRDLPRASVVCCRPEGALSGRTAWVCACRWVLSHRPLIFRPLTYLRLHQNLHAIAVRARAPFGGKFSMGPTEMREGRPRRA